MIITNPINLRSALATAFRSRLGTPTIGARVLNALVKRLKLARHDAAREGIAQIYLAAIGKTLALAQGQVLDRIGRIKNSAAIPLLFDLAAIKDSFDNGMAGAAQEALQASGQGMMTELGLDAKYEAPADYFHKFVLERKNKLADVPQEIYDHVKAEMEDGLTKGDSTEMLAARIKKVFGDISDGRARTIARTETASAYGTGRLSALKGAGIEYKAWLSADDGKVRASHTEAEEEGAIPVDENFGNGLAYPGDPSAPPEEVINCRCVVTAAQPPGKGEL